MIAENLMTRKVEAMNFRELTCLRSFVGMEMESKIVHILYVHSLKCT